MILIHHVIFIYFSSKISKANPSVNTRMNTRRNRVKGSNVRGVKNVGTAEAACGGGG